MINADGSSLFIPMHTLTFSEQDYCKQKRHLTRLKARRMFNVLSFLKGRPNVHVMLERPMVNPTRFRASVSAIRCLEATLIVLQDLLYLPIEYIDSKAWQKEMLPMGCTGGPELKRASKDLGIRRFPQFTKQITKVGDADGLHIASFCRKEHRG